MRLLFLSFIFFVGSAVSALPLVERRSSDDNSLRTRELDSTLSDLYLRNEFSLLDARDAQEFSLERRDPKAPETPTTPQGNPPQAILEKRINAAKKTANRQVRETRKKEAKKQIKAAGNPAAKAAEKTELKNAAQAKHNVMKAAGKAYKDSAKGLPERNSKSNGRKQTPGKDVRKNRYNLLVNKAERKPATNQKKIANKEARKDQKKAAKAQVEGAGPDPAAKAAKKTELKKYAQDKHSVKKDAGKAYKKTPDLNGLDKDARRGKFAEVKEKTQAKHAIKKAGQAYKGTGGLPDRNAVYSSPAGGTFTGKQVRESLFTSHVVHQAKELRKGAPAKFGEAEFRNEDHAGGDTKGTTKPIPSMTGQGREHTYTTAKTNNGRKKAHQNVPTRLITQYDPNTQKHNLAGVISHDAARPTDAVKGINDHYQLHPAV
ncbi:hypothetical protein C8J56DRAFT_1019370 [Mycena floridula]|nr:hypothetical protein C8J56DRAFT_1019370 [Mycena floridula]